MLVKTGNVVSVANEIEAVSHKSAFRAMRDTAACLRSSSIPIALPIVVNEIAVENTRDLLSILYAVKKVGAGFRSVTEPIVDTTSQVAEVIIAVPGIVAGWQSHRITERGRVQAKARAVEFGRRAALTYYQQAEALQRLADGDTQHTVAALVGVNQATISRMYRNMTE